MTVKHFPFPDLMRYCGRESEITISDDSPTSRTASCIRWTEPNSIIVKGIGDEENETKW